MIEKIGPTIYKGGTIYNIGAGGGGGSPQLFREQIKDNIYTYVKIGNLYFTIDNLKEDFPGVQNSFSAGSPCRQTVAGYDIFGYFYNHLAVNLIKNWLIDNNSDWRIATKEDFETLLDYPTNTLKLPIIWNNPIGNNNETGFSCLGSGYFNSASHRQTGEVGYFITTTQSATKNYYLQINDENDVPAKVVNTYYSDLNSWPIRLVKDVV